MNVVAERQFLQAQIAELDHLIALTGDHPLMAPSLLSRKHEMERRLAVLPGLGRTPQAILYFAGRPVRGSQGIDAEFASKILKSVQEMTDVEFLHRKQGILQRGRMPDASEARLLLTALPRGSFGLELVQADSSDLVSTQQLGDSLQHVADLVRAAGDSDAEYDAALEDAPERLLPKLREFFETLQRYDARLRLVTGDREIALDNVQIAAGVERVAATESSEENLALAGAFRGATLDTWRFDFKPVEGDPISGRMGETLTEAAVREMLTQVDRPAIGTFRRIALTPRGGTPRWRYELLSLQPQQQIENAP